MERWHIQHNVSNEAAYAVLAVDRIWNGYGIADLEEPFRSYTTATLAHRGNEPPTAACILLRHPAFCAIVAYGDAEGFDAILEALELPDHTFILARQEHLPAIQQRYDFPQGILNMTRMWTTAANFRPAATVPEEIERLGPDDLPALHRLYASYPENAFNDDQVLHGIFYGVRQDGEVLAAGGVHVLAPHYGIGAIGNVYTRAEARGRGYASAITSCIATDLLAGTFREVILNVRTNNDQAARIYTRLGFAPYCTYLEAPAQRKP